MAKAHFIAPVVPLMMTFTTRLGQVGQIFVPADEGKLVKLTAESRFELCAAGDPIEALVVAVETGLSGGYSVGSIVRQGIAWALADGLQATPGVGTLAVGDVVVAGTITARGTVLGSYPKVCKATNQPGAVAADLTAAGQQARNAMFPWRVVSLGLAATGAVGTTVVIQRV